MEVTVILQLISYAVGIIGGGYGIMMRKKLVRFQLKTERAKTSYYQSKKKAEDMRKTKDFVETGKTFWDWLTGNKTDSNERL